MRGSSSAAARCPGSPTKGEQSDPKASAPLSIRGPGLDKAKVTSAWPESTGVRCLQADRLEAEIGPGGLIVIEW